MIRRLPVTIVLALVALLAISALSIAQDSTADELPDAGAALLPGRYVVSAVGPTIEFRVGDGWQVGPVVDGPIVILERTDVPGAVLTITRFEGDVFIDSCDPSSLTTVEATVARLVEVIGGNPRLNAAPPSPADVDDRLGITLDVATPAIGDCAVRDLLLWIVPAMEKGEFVQVANQQSRFIMVDVDGDIVVIAIETFPGVPFGSMLDASMDLVGSMRFEAATSVATPEPTPETTEIPAATEAPGPPPESTPVVDRTPTPMATDAPDA